jgi:hypothetical protein
LKPDTGSKWYWNVRVGGRCFRVPASAFSTLECRMCFCGTVRISSAARFLLKK